MLRSGALRQHPGDATLELPFLIGIAALGGPLAIVLFYTFVRPQAALSLFGAGGGEDLDNALRGLRISLALGLFTTAFLAGLATALLSRTSGF